MKNELLGYIFILIPFGLMLWIGALILIYVLVREIYSQMKK